MKEGYELLQDKARLKIISQQSMSFKNEIDSLYTDSFALLPDSEISHVMSCAIQESGIPFVYFQSFSQLKQIGLQ